MKVTVFSDGHRKGGREQQDIASVSSFNSIINKLFTLHFFIFSIY
jgi:hypothetical protein